MALLTADHCTGHRCLGGNRILIRTEQALPLSGMAAQISRVFWLHFTVGGSGKASYIFIYVKV